MNAPIRISMAVPAPPPIGITYVSPATAPHATPTPVRIYGARFQSGATVAVNGAQASNVVWMSATTINCTFPSGIAGAATVVVTNPDGTTATSSSAFTYT